jgi:hypothetical protein
MWRKLEMRKLKMEDRNMDCESLLSLQQGGGKPPHAIFAGEH